MNFPFHLMLLSNLLLFCGRQWQKHIGAYASVIDLYEFCISLQFLYVHFCLFQWVKNFRTWNLSSRSFFFLGVDIADAVYVVQITASCPTKRTATGISSCSRDLLNVLVSVLLTFSDGRRTCLFFYLPCPLHYPMFDYPLSFRSFSTRSPLGTTAS